MTRGKARKNKEPGKPPKGGRKRSKGGAELASKENVRIERDRLVVMLPAEVAKEFAPQSGDEFGATLSGSLLIVERRRTRRSP